jgi:predicted Rdx family selenoprotein
MVLFAVVGPVIVIEDLGVWQGLRRSASLTRSHALLVIVTVLIPTTLDEGISSWFERFAWYAHPWVHLPLDVGATIIVGGLVGVLEVTLAHALISDRRRRLGALAEAHEVRQAEAEPQLADR